MLYHCTQSRYCIDNMLFLLVQYLYVLAFCVVGAIAYLPCVHYKRSTPKLSKSFIALVKKILIRFQCYCIYSITQ
jgi:hypothetical protein